MLIQTNAKNLAKATRHKCLEDKQNIFNSFPGLRQLDLQELDHAVPRLVWGLFLNNVIIFGRIHTLSPLPLSLCHFWIPLILTIIVILILLTIFTILSFKVDLNSYHHCHPHPYHPHHHHHHHPHHHHYPHHLPFPGWRGRRSRGGRESWSSL